MVTMLENVLQQCKSNVPSASFHVCSNGRSTVDKWGVGMEEISNYTIQDSNTSNKLLCTISSRNSSIVITREC